MPSVISDAEKRWSLAVNCTQAKLFRLVLVGLSSF
jgi:hypothetical protein